MSDASRPARRKRYGGTHPRHFEEKYKERDPARFPALAEKLKAKGKTPAGTHVPILVEQVVAALAPRPGEVMIDATVGFGGHASSLAARLAPEGLLVGLDQDERALEVAGARLEELPHRLLRRSFRDLPGVLAELGLPGVDGLLADLGVSSPQIDDPSRGFSFRRDGPLDMRMDRRRPSTAADWLARLGEAELARALRELADEPDADALARAISRQQARAPITRTLALADLVLRAKGIDPGAWRARAREGDPGSHPAARTFQALRVLVNDELGVLDKLLGLLPRALAPGGRVAILSFHSGEDRRVKLAFREGLRTGVYAATCDEPIRPDADEVRANTRAAPARLRWARRA